MFAGTSEISTRRSNSSFSILILAVGVILGVSAGLLALVEMADARAVSLRAGACSERTPNSAGFLISVRRKVSDQCDGVGVGQEWMP